MYKSHFTFKQHLSNEFLLHVLFNITLKHDYGYSSIKGYGYKA